MRPVPEILALDMPVSAAAEHARNGGLDAWPVGDAAGFLGMIRRLELEAAIAAGGSDKPIRDIVRSNGLAHLHPGHSLSIALERMGRAGENVLPVVSRARLSQLVGIVTLEDILRAYGVSENSI